MEKAIRVINELKEKGLIADELEEEAIKNAKQIEYKGVETNK